MSTSDSLARSRAAGVERGLGRGPIAEHVPVDEAHHVERRVVDGLVVAEPECRRDRHGADVQAGDDAVLAAHVVGAGEQVAERRAAQHEGAAVGAGDAVGQVGVTAGDDVEA